MVGFLGGRLVGNSGGFLVGLGSGRLVGNSGGFLVGFGSGRLVGDDGGFLVGFGFASGRLVGPPHSPGVRLIRAASRSPSSAPGKA